MVARKATKKQKPTQGMAIAGLVLNILILPGLGSLINDRVKEGVYQLLLAVFGIIFVFAGIFMMINMVGWTLFCFGAILIAAAWIWGLVTGIKLIKEAK